MKTKDIVKGKKCTCKITEFGLWKTNGHLTTCPEYSKSLSNWRERFDKKFHERVWNIVKQIHPASYVQAEEMGLLEGDGPQIYGEIKDFIASEIELAKLEARKEVMQQIANELKEIYRASRGEDV